MTDWYRKAQEIARQSLDPSTKVGCVAVSPDGVHWASECNDFPQGIPSEWWDERSLKYAAVVHAEVATLVNIGHRARGGTLYVTAHPCSDCAKVIAVAGIKCVVCPPGPWRDDPAVIETVQKAARIFQLCGVEVVHVKG